MSRTSSTLDLSEFFNDDDSEGHRLVEFIQNRRGCFQRQNFLLMNYEPQRLSLNVQLEKIPILQEVSFKTNVDKNSVCNVNHGTANDAGQRESFSISPDRVRSEHPNKGQLITSTFQSASETRLPCVRSGPISPEFIQNPCTTASLAEHSLILNRLNPSHAIGRRFSSLRKSVGGVSPCDRLRRYSLKKRLSKHCGGRRTLLEEFESTIGDSNFLPAISSTPISQPERNNRASVFNSVETNDAENAETNSSEKSPIINKSCCGHTDTLVKSLQRNDEELKRYMEDVIDTTLKKMQDQSVKNKIAEKSPLKRIYTVENGNISGQVVLTPERNTSDISNRQSNLLNSKTHVSPNNSLRSENHRSPSLRTMASFRGSNNKEIFNSPTLQQQEKLPSTTYQRSVSIIFPTQDIEIPETQQHPEAQNPIMVQSTPELPVVIIPVNQTFNKTYDKENLNKTNLVKAKSSQAKNNKSVTSAAKQIQEHDAEMNDNQLLQNEEDNLKLTDILTDDEDEPPKSATRENNSQVPLNLASSITKSRIKRLRKRLVLPRRMPIDYSQQHTNETETESAAEVRTSRRSLRRKQIPLNRAPGIPLNGEKFAEELSRMSNYEILDLRKRNSMGQVFAVLGRRSRRCREEAEKKKLELDNQIKMEILKRNIGENTDKQESHNNPSCAEVEETRLPVPDGFQDSPQTSREVQENIKDLSLLHEQTIDRVSFKNSANKKRQIKSKKEQISDVLVQYLQVSNTLTRKKSKKSLNMLKRSLFTPEEYDQKISHDSRQQSVSSKSNSNLVTVVNVVSPTTEKSALPEIQLQVSRNEEEEILHKTPEKVDENFSVLPLPPPPGFESGSIINSNNKNSTTVISNTAFEDVTQTNPSNDNNLFKKPQRPAPKRRARKEKVNLGNEELTIDHSATNSADVTEGTLRRSKRNHVPFNNTPKIVQVLYQEAMNRRLKYYEKRKEKQKALEISNRVKLTESTNGSYKSKLSPVPENDTFISCLRSDAEILNKKKRAKPKSRTVRKSNKKLKKIEEIPSESYKCSRLILDRPPPVDHLNKVFDQLKNTSSLKSASSKIVSVPQKVKPFKIRIARLKSSTETTPCRHDFESSSTSTTTSNSNFELISWLKNITDSDRSMSQNEKIFKEMRISSASNINFTELQGVEYAFYDTDEKSSLGYLRFKPRQIKPKKKTKRYHLHFITLVGNFRITANSKESRTSVGDMVAIEKSVYYDIENLTDDIAILMVVKK